MTGEVVYASANKLGCDVFERPLKQAALPVFLLVDRGDCYFIEKVLLHAPLSCPCQPPCFGGCATCCPSCSTF